MAERYDSLRLNTPARYDRLPGIDWEMGGWEFPTGAQMGDLLESYAARYDMDVRHGTRVTRVERVGEGFQVTTNHGPSRADSVVVATGGEHHPRTPEVARALDPGIRQLHSSGYHNPSQLLAGPVLVVGAGQSGADIALELAQAGHETWLSGKPSGEIPVDLERRAAGSSRRCCSSWPTTCSPSARHGPADEAARCVRAALRWSA